MRTFCAILLGLLYASSVSAVDWQPVPGLEPAAMDNQEFRLDMDSILKNERFASVWSLTNYPKPQGDTIVKYQSTMDRMMFNCADNTYFLEASIHYSGKNGDGGQISRMVRPHHKQQLQDFGGSPILPKIKAVVCAKAD